VAFDQVAGVDALLMTAVPGTNLAAQAKSRPPAAIVEMLASALCAFHSVSARDCPFEAYIPGESLVHGDACLPNIVVADDGPAGYIDLGDTGVGNVEVNLSAAVWSLQYNLGPGFGRAFLAASSMIPRRNGATVASESGTTRRTGRSFSTIFCSVAWPQPCQAIPSSGKFGLLKTSPETVEQWDQV